MEIIAGLPCVDGYEGDVERRWDFEDFWIGDDGEEFMDAWTWDGPIGWAFAKLFDDLFGRGVKRTFLAMGVDEDVGVDGNHAPCL